MDARSPDAGAQGPTLDAAVAVADPAQALKQSLFVSAGGPYVAQAGLPITLRGRALVPEQAVVSDRLAAIGAALQGYLAVNGTFPPAALLDANGQPTVSWRVLLLPYLGEQDLYKRFDLTKHWNDPANMPLLASIPAVFQAAGATAGTTDTGFAGVTGAGSLFEKASDRLDGGLSLKAINLGVTDHFAVGPVGANVHLPWSAPSDLDIAAATKLGSPNGFSGAGNTLTPLLFLDGTVHLIPNTVGSFAMLGWAKLSANYCICTPPNLVEVQLRAFWDLDGSGKFATAGLNASFLPSKPGSYKIAMRVIDGFGGPHDSTATVEAQ